MSERPGKEETEGDGTPFPCMLGKRIRWAPVNCRRSARQRHWLYAFGRLFGTLSVVRGAIYPTHRGRVSLDWKRVKPEAVRACHGAQGCELLSCRELSVTNRRPQGRGRPLEFGFKLQAHMPHVSGVPVWTAAPRVRILVYVPTRRHGYVSSGWPSAMPSGTNPIRLAIVAVLVGCGGL